MAAVVKNDGLTHYKTMHAFPGFQKSYYHGASASALGSMQQRCFYGQFHTQMRQDWYYYERE